MKKSLIVLVVSRHAGVEAVNWVGIGLLSLWSMEVGDMTLFVMPSSDVKAYLPPNRRFEFSTFST